MEALRRPFQGLDSHGSEHLRRHSQDVSIMNSQGSYASRHGGSVCHGETLLGLNGNGLEVEIGKGLVSIPASSVVGADADGRLALNGTADIRKRAEVTRCGDAAAHRYHGDYVVRQKIPHPLDDDGPDR